MRRLAALIRIARERWGDPSVAAGWLVRRAAEDLDVALGVGDAYRLMAADRRHT